MQSTYPAQIGMPRHFRRSSCCPTRVDGCRPSQAYWYWWRRILRQTVPGPAGPAESAGPELPPVWRRVAPCSCRGSRSRSRCLCGGLLTLRPHCLDVGDLGEIRLDLAGFHGVGVGHQFGNTLGLGVRHQRVVDPHRPVLARRLVVGKPRRSSGTRGEEPKKIAGMAMTATAVPSAMRIRTAPPFVGHARRARLCSV